ncbi:MAG TPA: anaerobic ribonucleoside-triphosphate reductase activating protein [Thermoprotei archaeon]|nr:anaerobic ribonucleoside-triphosphate reductase activating protein [Thermoprotei archaeon]
MKVLVAGWRDLSTVDMIGEPCFVIWLCGCNFRCPWCQNWHIVECFDCRWLDPQTVAERAAENLGLVEYVHVTGGEPTLQDKGLLELCRALKEKGLKVSVDTNGSRPEVLERILPYLNHMAIDIKAPLSEPDKYARAIGLPLEIVESYEIPAKVEKSLQVGLCNLEKVEIRLPVVPKVHEPSDVLRAAHEVEEVVGRTRFWNKAVVVLQQYVPSETVPSPFLREQPMTDAGLLQALAYKILDETEFTQIYIRAVDSVIKIKRNSFRRESL